jgi:hypothetical protein
VKKIKVFDNKCLSVGCDFYQTCAKNSVSFAYQTRLKFMPIIKNETECHSSTSGKRFDMRDNNYPNKMDYIYEYRLYSAKDVVDFL